MISKISGCLHKGIVPASIFTSIFKKNKRNCSRGNFVIKLTNLGGLYYGSKWQLEAGPRFGEGDIITMD